MFTQMRAAFGADRARANAIWWEKNEPAQGLLTHRQMLEAATINGAHVAGLESRTGSLTPGKQADVVLLDATAINMTPIHDPVAAVVLCADVSNVEAVLVDGEWRKRDFRLVADVANARTLVENSRDYLLAEAKSRAAAA
jgi:cytosine/adenosine deaminase-related metal-dependent hydrolase